MFRYGKINSFWHVRVWLFEYIKLNRLTIEWHLKSFNCFLKAQFEKGADNDAKFSIAFPPISLYFNIERMPNFIMNLLDQRVIGLQIRDYKLEVNLWNPLWVWSNKDPWWWSFDIPLLPFYG